MFAVGTGTIKKCLELWHSVIIKQVLFRLYRLITSVAFVHGRSFRCENDLIAVLPFIWWLWMRWFFSFAKILQFFTRHKIIVSCYSMFATVKVAWTRYFLSPPPPPFFYNVLQSFYKFTKFDYLSSGCEIQRLQSFVMFTKFKS